MVNPLLNDVKVKKVNEIYHDLEAEYYVQRHPEIYVEEKETWEHIGKTFLKTDKELTLLDIGTGTGFVPLLLSSHLKKNDRIICTDLSERMLKTTEQQMSHLTHIRKEFIKGDALAISNLDLKVDVITMNSVLHHIPDYEIVLPKLAKLINKGGLFIIMHERNKLYSQNKSVLLAVHQFLMRTYISMRKLAKKFLVMIKMYRKKGGAWEDFNHKVYVAINEKKIFDHELTIEDINSLVDIHDPDERGEGFDPFALQRDFFPDFEIASMDTYKNLGPWVNDHGNIINQLLAKKVKKDNPHAGALFWLILKK